MNSDLENGICSELPSSLRKLLSMTTSDFAGFVLQPTNLVDWSRQNLAFVEINLMCFMITSSEVSKGNFKRKAVKLSSAYTW